LRAHGALQFAADRCAVLVLAKRVGAVERVEAAVKPPHHLEGGVEPVGEIGPAVELAADSVQHQRAVAAALAARPEIRPVVEDPVNRVAVEDAILGLDGGGERVAVEAWTGSPVRVRQGEALAGRDATGDLHIAVLFRAVDVDVRAQAALAQQGEHEARIVAAGERRADRVRGDRAATEEVAPQGGQVRVAQLVEAGIAPAAGEVAGEARVVTPLGSMLSCASESRTSTSRKIVFVPKVAPWKTYSYALWGSTVRCGEDRGHRQERARHDRGVGVAVDLVEAEAVGDEVQSPARAHKQAEMAADVVPRDMRPFEVGEEAPQGRGAGFSKMGERADRETEAIGGLAIRVRLAGDEWGKEVDLAVGRVDALRTAETLPFELGEQDGCGASRRPWRARGAGGRTLP
jgi:hypothetical protein